MAVMQLISRTIHKSLSIDVTELGHMKRQVMVDENEVSKNYQPNLSFNTLITECYTPEMVYFMF